MRGVGRAAHLALVVGGLVLIIAVEGLPAVTADIASVTAFLVIFPLTNALYDYLSYGLTIWLLRLGHRRGGATAFLCALADIFVAALLFAALSATLVAIMGSIDGQRGEPLFDLPALLPALRESPGDYLWLVAMVASTLLPTLVHLILGLISVTALIPARLWTSVINRLDFGISTTRTHKAAISYGLLLTLYILVPLALIYGAGWLLWTFGADLRAAYIAGLIDWAHWLGVF